MKITRDIIIDLLPLYFSGEASTDTKELVEAYFDQNPEFAKEAKKSSEQIMANDVPVNLTKEDEMNTLNRTKKLILIRSILLGIAIFFSIVPATVLHLGGKTYWFALEAPMSALTYGLIGVVFWIGFFIMRYKIRTSGL